MVKTWFRVAFLVTMCALTACDEQASGPAVQGPVPENKGREASNARSQVRAVAPKDAGTQELREAALRVAATGKYGDNLKVDFFKSPKYVREWNVKSSGISSDDAWKNCVAEVLVSGGQAYHVSVPKFEFGGWTWKGVYP